MDLKIQHKHIHYAWFSFATRDGLCPEMETHDNGFHPGYVNSKMKKPVKSKDIVTTLIEELNKVDIKAAPSSQIIQKLLGKPDIVIPKYKVAIFMDMQPVGINDYRHGDIELQASFWQNDNVARLQRAFQENNEIKQIGWKVLRFWRENVQDNVSAIVADITALVHQIAALHQEPPRFTFVDLFAGIGGFRIPLERLGGHCLGFSEIDTAAIQSYKRNFFDFTNEDELELGSVTDLNVLPVHPDLITGGVPCQSWSVAGKMRGFDDPRGQLWFDSIRIVTMNQPKAFIFENVKGLYDPRNKANLVFLVNEFNKAGYQVSYKLLNSYDFGLPQNRDRVYLVGIRNDLARQINTPFQFPKPLGIIPKLFDFIEDVECEEVQKVKIDQRYLFGEKIPLSRNRCQKLDELNDFFTFCDTRNGHSTIHSWELQNVSDAERLICICIMKNRRKKKYGNKDGNPLSLEQLRELMPADVATQANLDSLVGKRILRVVPNRGYEFVNSKNSAGINNVYRVYLPTATLFSTLTATGTRDFVARRSITANNPRQFKQGFIDEIFHHGLYKSITSRDAGCLQGFPPEFIFHEKEELAMKQFGNAVSVPVVYHVACQLVNTGVFDL